MLRVTALPDKAGAGEKYKRYFSGGILELDDDDLDLGKGHRVGLLDGLRTAEATWIARRSGASVAATWTVSGCALHLVEPGGGRWVRSSSQARELEPELL